MVCTLYIMGELSEQQILNQIAGRLAESYRNVPADEVSRVVHSQYVRFDGRPIRDFVPLFVERHAKTELATHGG